MLLILALLFYPTQTYDAAWWYLQHIHIIVGVLILVDLVFWYGMYKKYRKQHPYERVTLTKF